MIGPSVSNLGYLPFLLLVTLPTTLASPLQIPLSSKPLSHGPTAPYRPLTWGDLNIIHTTDTHGWLLGHPEATESSYSGNLGDVYSFMTRMKEQAVQKGVDLLIVDSGDRVDGNGIVDGEPWKAATGTDEEDERVKGYSAMKIFQELPYDIITTGNHELYNYTISLSTQQNIATHYGENYVTSNVEVTLPSGKTVGLGQRYRRFTTLMGKKGVALGPLFDFKAHARGTTVQSIEEMIKEDWFKEVITPEKSVDFFLLVGHMSIRPIPSSPQSDSQFALIHAAIRSLHPYTPILILGGHHHIRDCLMLDNRSMSLASGRYMESLGWMSVKGLTSPPSAEPLVFSRRYLDQNRVTYGYHAGDEFDTAQGLNISQALKGLANDFNLTRIFGQAPHSYYLSRFSPTSEQSILNLMTSKVLPLLVRRDDRPFKHLTVLNSGSIRFDIFQGEFTRNDQWIILPFTNNFNYISGVRRSTALKLLDYLNLIGEHGLLSSSIPSSRSVNSIYQASLVQSYHRYLSESSNSPEGEFTSTFKVKKKLTPGYVTHDTCPEKGDDTLHTPVPAFPQPIFVSTDFPSPSSNFKEENLEEERLDIVFFDFIMIDIISALNVLQSEKIFKVEEVGLFVEGLTANTIMQEYASREWN